MFFFQVQGQIYIEFFSTHREVFFRECHATQCVWGGGDVFLFFFLLGKSPDEGGKEGDKGLARRLPHTEGVARCLKAILRGNLDARNSRICFPTLNNIEKSKKMN